MSIPHIADARSQFQVVCVGPDFCLVNGQVVPFEISQTLEPERLRFTARTLARGARILTVGSVIKGVVGNMGQGVFSGVSGGSGHVVLLTGSPTVKAEGQAICRHGDVCAMNVGI
jgi:hypothetical protein